MLPSRSPVRRIDAGALTLASPEVKFDLDQTSLDPTDVTSYTLYEANALVEEFMLLANVTVGKRILRQVRVFDSVRRAKRRCCRLSRSFL